MKVAERGPFVKVKATLRGQVFSLSQAKTYLGRLIEKAHKGERVYILKGHRRFVLEEVPEIEPIPMRPPGYFTDCYTKEVIEEDNRLAKASVVSAPRDLE
jgi:hypothetical protein